MGYVLSGKAALVTGANRGIGKPSWTRSSPLA